MLSRNQKKSSYIYVLLLLLLVLFVLQVARKASTRAHQRCRSAETRSRRPHVQPFSFISLSTVLLQVSLGRPLFLWPSGVHRRAILVMFTCQGTNIPENTQFYSCPHRLGGLVVRASALRAEDPGFKSCLRRDFSRVESYQ